MSNVLNKILMGISIFLVCICGWLYYSKTGLEKENIKQTNTIENLESDLRIVKKNIENLSALNQELDTIIQRSRVETRLLREDRDGTLDQLKEIENVKKTENTNSDSLDPALTRVLSNLCERVRGSPCPDP